MQNSKKGVKLNNERVSFSKDIKRKILMEVIKGKTSKEALLLHAFNSIKDISADRDYASKLIYKWRKKIYKNRELFYFINQKITPGLLEHEIQEMADNEIYPDDIIGEALDIYEGMLLRQNISTLDI